MIPDDEFITISDILSISDKGKNMTIAEKERLDYLYSILPNTNGTYDERTDSIIPFDHNQRQFVTYILTSYLRYNVPNLNEVLAIYNLKMNSVYVWQAI